MGCYYNTTVSLLGHVSKIVSILSVNYPIVPILTLLCNYNNSFLTVYFVSNHIRHLHNNLLHCDCKLQWLPDLFSTVSQGLPATCATPANLYGVAVVSLTEDQFVCGEFPDLM